MSVRRKRVIRLLFMLTLLLVLLFCGVMTFYPGTPEAPLFSDTVADWSGGWRADGGRALNLPCVLEPARGGIAHIEKRLPDPLPEDAMVVVRTDYLPIEARAGDEKLTVSGTFMDNGPFRLTYAISASVIRVPASAAGEVLRVTLYPEGSKARMELYGATLGTGDGVRASYMTNDQNINLMGWMLALLAGFLLVFALFLRRNSEREHFVNFFYTGLILLFAAVWILTDIGLNAVSYGWHSAYVFVNLFSYMLISVPFIILLRAHLRVGRRLLRALAALALALNAAVALLGCMGVFDLSVTLTASHALYAVVLVACMACLIRALFNPGNQPVKPLFAGMLAAAATGVMTMGNFYLRCTPDNTSYFKYGIVFYALVMAYVAGKRAIDLMVEAQSAVRLKYAATHDDLTGLYNRHAFYEALQKELSDHPERALAVGSMDVSQFKLINDMFGREQGDRLLRHIAGALTRTLGADGLYARLESDKFLLCLPRAAASVEDAIRALDRRIAEFPIAFTVTMSYGWYVSGEERLSPEDMVDRSLLARETVKGSYVRHCAYYDERLRSEMLRERALIDQLPAALEEGQFVLYYQPKYRLDTGACCGAEALIRWKHPQNGLITPSRFIPLFERNGLITRLDEYVWARAGEMVRRLRERFGPDGALPISVNVSRVDLFNPNLLSVLTGIADRVGIPRALLPLEITESTYAEAPELLRQRVTDLRSAGFPVHMDDFGSGYSSLNMLKEIEVDQIKIDMGFLAGEDAGNRTRGIMTAIFGMAKVMNLGVVAEGVETAEQAQMLRALGCYAVQGYLYSPPVDEAAFVALLGGKTDTTDTNESGACE